MAVKSCWHIRQIICSIPGLPKPQCQECNNFTKYTGRTFIEACRDYWRAMKVKMLCLHSCNVSSHFYSVLAICPPKHQLTFQSMHSKNSPFICGNTPFPLADMAIRLTPPMGERIIVAASWSEVCLYKFEKTAWCNWRCWATKASAAGRGGLTPDSSREWQVQCCNQKENTSHLHGTDQILVEFWQFLASSGNLEMLCTNAELASLQIFGWMLLA